MNFILPTKISEYIIFVENLTRHIWTKSSSWKSTVESPHLLITAVLQALIPDLRGGTHNERNGRKNTSLNFHQECQVPNIRLIQVSTSILGTWNVWWNLLRWPSVRRSASAESNHVDRLPPLAERRFDLRKIPKTHTFRRFIYWVPSLKLTFSHLKINVWKMNFLLGRPIFWGYVSFREGKISIQK